MTVTELNRGIKRNLEKSFPLVWITGEISNLRKPSSGHLYFSLKDDQAQINAVMFRGQARRLMARLEDGLAVLGMGRVSVYEPRGTYQIILEYIEPQGRGDLRLAYEHLKQKLADEGLFDPANKKQIPTLPRKVHIITSPAGAVIFDMITIIQRRFANMPIVLIPTSVQGPRAAADIVLAIDILNRQADAQVAILARGGGSLEDLQAYNDEGVARAIHQSKTPIIAAIGHETDYTIADFVADDRAPTPSAAAESIVPDRTVLMERLQSIAQQLKRAVATVITLQKERLGICQRHLTDPRQRIYDARLRLDDLTQRMMVGVPRLMRDDRRDLIHLASLLIQNPLPDRIQLLKQLHREMHDNLLEKLKNKTLADRWRVNAMVSRLRALSPLAVLERGYSITRLLPRRAILKSSHQTDLNDRVEITLASGRLQCRIEGKEDDDEKKI